MHIGRAHQPPPDIQQASAAQQAQGLQRGSPIAVAHHSAPTGESGDPTPTYHPVTDLIQRQTRLHDLAPDAADAAQRPVDQVYDGTPPPPPVVDLRA